MDPYQHSTRVRGGFSPLVSGNWTPTQPSLQAPMFWPSFSSQLAGLGDLCDPTDPSCAASGPFVSLANPTLNMDSSTSSIITWMTNNQTLVVGLGAIGVIALLWNEHKGR